MRMSKVEHEYTMGLVFSHHNCTHAHHNPYHTIIHVVSNKTLSIFCTYSVLCLLYSFLLLQCSIYKNIWNLRKLNKIKGSKGGVAANNTADSATVSPTPTAPCAPAPAVATTDVHL